MNAKDKELGDFKDIKSFNLSETHDKFYNQNVDSDYGKIAREVTELLSKLKKATPSFVKEKTFKNPNLDPDEDEQLAELNQLKEAVDKLPELKK